MLESLSLFASNISKIGYYFIRSQESIDEERINTIHKIAINSILSLEEHFCAKSPEYSKMFKKVLESEFFFEKTKKENHLIWGYNPIDRFFIQIGYFLKKKPYDNDPCGRDWNDLQPEIDSLCRLHIFLYPEYLKKDENYIQLDHTIQLQISSQAEEADKARERVFDRLTAHFNIKQRDLTKGTLVQIKKTINLHMEDPITIAVINNAEEAAKTQVDSALSLGQNLTYTTIGLGTLYLITKIALPILQSHISITIK